MVGSSGESISSQQVFLASPPLAPGSDEARLMTAGSGRRLCGLRQKPGPLGEFLRTLLESSAWSSGLTLLTWDVSTVPSHSVLDILIVAGPVCEATGCSDFILLRRISRLSDTRSSLLLFRLVPSMPRIDGIESGLWPTLLGVTKLWPTPRNNSGPSKDAHHLSLDGAVKLLPTPDANCWKGGAENQRKGQLNGQLNPVFVEWLMGFPEGWTDLDASAMPSSRKRPTKSSGKSEV